MESKIIDFELVKNCFLPRNEESYKGDFGHTLIIAGSVGFTGAPYIVSQTAVRSGAGLVTLGVYPELMEIMSMKAIEYMTVSLSEKDRLLTLLDKCSCVAFGPGMGNSERTRKYLEDTLAYCSSPIVLDADGLNVLAGDMEPILKKRGAIIMTPHLGEFSRLIHIPITEIKKNMEQFAKDFAKKYKIILVLKDHRTVVTDGKTIYRNSTGNSHMASGGMGDCLTGLIASLISQGYEPFKAAVMGVYLHGYCGDELAKNHFCVTASDMIEKIPEVLSYFYNANL